MMAYLGPLGGFSAEEALALFIETDEKFLDDEIKRLEEKIIELDKECNVILVGKNIGVENYIPPQEVYGIIANPVCTDFSVAKNSNALTYPDMIIVDACLQIIKKCDPIFWVIENPASGRLKNYLGKPNFVYEPWQFGSPWTKRTALWGKFHAPKPIYSKWEDVIKNENLYIRPGRKKPGLAFLHKSAKRHIREFDRFDIDDDASFRSLCPQTFARAFFEANP